MPSDKIEELKSIILNEDVYNHRINWKTYKKLIQEYEKKNDSARKLILAFKNNCEQYCQEIADLKQQLEAEDKNRQELVTTLDVVQKQLKEQRKKYLRAEDEIKQLNKNIGTKEWDKYTRQTREIKRLNKIVQGHKCCLRG